VIIFWSQVAIFLDWTLLDPCNKFLFLLQFPVLPIRIQSFAMFRTQLIRQSTRAVRASRAPIAIRNAPLSWNRLIHDSPPLLRDEKKEEDHEGSFARTDPTVEVEYPEEGDLPSSTPVQGRGGLHFKRTLASFSLEGRVGVVTGGARGLGLVMSQAMVISGADVAIVDLNSTFLYQIQFVSY